MPPVPSSPGFQLALVQLPGRLRRALRIYRKITGLTAVTSLATSIPEPGTPFALSPPVHPRCAKKLQSIPNAPCGEQWLIHVRSGRRSRRSQSHTCPIGLRCSCVPIQLGDQLVGVAKLVVDSDTPQSAVTAAVSVLKLMVSETCQDSVVALLSEELTESRQRLSGLKHVRSVATPDAEEADGQGAALVDRALAHLQRYHQDAKLSLPAVAKTLGCNPRYLTTRFTQIVGERMHTHLITLRVSHACRLLTGTNQRVKEVAFASGFTEARRLESAFRRHVGVSPREYRRIFTGH